MQPVEYDAMFRVEDTHWWYVGLREIVLALLADAVDLRKATILDAGCGTGGLLRRLGARSCGIEIAEAGLRHCRERGLTRLVRGSLLALPFRAESFDAVVSLDVLCHAWVADDVAALVEMRRVLVPRGVVLLHLPASPRLLSVHDAAVMTRRRYTRRGLAAALARAGFEPLRLTYRNTLLFPLAAARRLAGRWWPTGDASAARSDVGRVPGPLNRGLLGVLRLDNALALRAPLPFGLSLVCLARKT